VVDREGALLGSVGSDMAASMQELSCFLEDRVQVRALFRVGDVVENLLPTDDDVMITWDGRVINTKEKLLAFLKEIDAERAAGLTFEELEARAREHEERYGPVWTHLNWDWDPSSRSSIVTASST